MVSARFVSVYDTELSVMQKQVVSGSQGAFVMCVALVGSVSKQTIKLNVRLIYEKLTESVQRRDFHKLSVSSLCRSTIYYYYF